MKIVRNMKIWRNLKFIISLNYYISLIYYISPDLFSFGRSARFCQKFFIVKNSIDLEATLLITTGCCNLVTVNGNCIADVSSFATDVLIIL